ncbi:MAG: hypothetical protein DRP63_02655 [Planctomycetota bacterium]|nr:MAG: hypothetical protein DRP63_02655 [Planctomycetota bacterium]
MRRLPPPLLLVLLVSALFADQTDQLIRQLSSDDYATRKAAFIQLAKMCPAIQQRLLRAQKDATPQARYCIAKLLRLCHIRRQQERVRKLLLDAGIGEREASRTVRMLFGTGRGMRVAALMGIAKGAPKTLPALFAAAEDMDEQAVMQALVLAAHACASANRVPQKRLFWALFERRPKPKQPQQSVNALLAVADLGDAETAEAIAQLCTDGRRLAVAEARIRLSKNPSAVSTLLRLAVDENADVRQQAALCLQTAAAICDAIPLPEACRKWVEKALRGDDAMRRAVAAVVARCPSNWTKTMALSFLDSTDEEIVVLGIEAAGRWKMKEAVARLGALALEARFTKEAAEALAKIGQQEAVQALKHAAFHSNTPYRAPIYEALIKLQKQRTADILLAALLRLKTLQEKREVENYLARLFARHFGKEEEKALIGVLRKVGSDAAAAVVAADLLGQFGSKEAEKALAQLLKTPNRLLVVKPYCLMRGAEEARKWVIRGGMESFRAAEALAVLGNAEPLLRLSRLQESITAPLKEAVRNAAASAHASLVLWNANPNEVLSLKKDESLYTIAQRLAKKHNLLLRTDLGLALITSKDNLAKFVATTIHNDGSLQVQRMLATVVLDGGSVEQALGQLSSLFEMRVAKEVVGRKLPLYGLMLQVRVPDVLRLISAAGGVQIRIEKGKLVVEAEN